MTSKYGFELFLSTTSPRRVINTFKADLLETIARRDLVALQLRHQSAESQDLLDRGLFLQPLRTLYNRLKGDRKVALHNIINDGIWTNTDLVNKGYNIDPICGDCNEGLDTVYHRCFTCVKIETRARCSLGSSLYDSIIQKGDTSLLANRCLMPHPVMTSAPSKVTRFESLGFEESDSFLPGDGEVFGDGSCLYPSDGSLARAGFGCVQIRPDGTLAKAIYGCVPVSLPQSSLAGEYAALACAYDNGYGNIFAGDCQDVISGFNMGIEAALKTAGPHVCTWKSILLRHPDFDLKVISARKVKAHQAEPGPDCSHSDFCSYWGNYHADLCAKQGAALHAPASSDVDLVRSAKQDLTNLALHMVDTLSTLRLARVAGTTKAELLPRQARPVVKHASLHDFRWNGNIWVCIKCFLRTSSLSSSYSFSPCIKRSPLAAISRADKGHVLWQAPLADGGNIIYCSNCWCYASAYPRNLLRPCCKPSGGSRPCAKFHLVNRRHPRSRTRFLLPLRLRVS